MALGRGSVEPRDGSRPLALTLRDAAARFGPIALSLPRQDLEPASRPQ
jgi:hypothetical protein